MSPRSLTSTVWATLGLLVLATFAPAANAAVTHNFLKAISALPATGPHGESISPPLLLQEPRALTVDSGQLLDAEKFNSSVGNPLSRVDAFETSTGALALQFPQPAPPLSQTFNGIAVRHPFGEAAQVFVGAADENGGGRIAVFSATGVLLSVWTGKSALGEPFGGAGVSDLAVDGSSRSTDWAKGDVFDVNASAGVVDVFAPAAGGGEPGPSGVVARLAGTCATEETTCVGTVIPFVEPSRVAVDQSTGDVLVADGAVVDLFEPTGLLGEFKFLRQIATTPAGPLGRVRAIAASSGEIYIAQEHEGEGGRHPVVDQYDFAARHLGRLTGTPAGAFEIVQSLAVDPASGGLYIGESRGLVVHPFSSLVYASRVLPV